MCPWGLRASSGLPPDPVEFSACHRFDHPLDQVAAAFLDPAAHVGRYELVGDRDIEVLQVTEADGALDLQTVRTVQGEVPAVAQKIIKATNTVTTTDRWDRADGGTVRGTSRVEASNVPGTATITATLQAAGPDACTYDVDLDLALKIPLIGDRFVKLLRPQVQEILDAEFDAWDRWLAQGGAS